MELVPSRSPTPLTLEFSLWHCGKQGPRQPVRPQAQSPDRTLRALPSHPPPPRPSAGDPRTSTPLDCSLAQPQRPPLQCPAPETTSPPPAPKTTCPPAPKTTSLDPNPKDHLPQTPSPPPTPQTTSPPAPKTPSRAPNPKDPFPNSQPQRPPPQALTSKTTFPASSPPNHLHKPQPPEQG